MSDIKTRSVHQNDGNIIYMDYELWSCSMDERKNVIVKESVYITDHSEIDYADSMKIMVMRRWINIFWTKLWAENGTRFVSRFARDFSIVLTLPSTTKPKSFNIVFLRWCFQMLIEGRKRWFWLRFRFFRHIESTIALETKWSFYSRRSNVFRNEVSIYR